MDAKYHHNFWRPVTAIRNAPIATTSPSAGGNARQWQTVESFIQEVCDARIYGGMHFRTSTQVAELMGRQIGEVAAKRLRQRGL